MTLGTAQRRAQRLHQRIGEVQPDAGHEAAVDAPAALVEMLPGLLQVAQAAVGHPQRVVHDRRGRVPAQHGFQVLDGRRVIAGRRRRPAELEPHHRRARPQRARLVEERLRRIPAAQVDVDVDLPEERGEIARTPVAGPPEGLGRLVQVAAPLVEMPQVVGPAEPLGRQPPRIQQADLRGVEVLARHQQHAQPAVGVSEVARGGRSLGLQRPVGVAKLNLHGLVHAAQVGQRDRPNLRVVDDARRPASRQEAGDEPAAEQHRAAHGN